MPGYFAEAHDRCVGKCCSRMNDSHTCMHTPARVPKHVHLHVSKASIHIQPIEFNLTEIQVLAHHGHATDPFEPYKTIVLGELRGPHGTVCGRARVSPYGCNSYT